MATSLTDESGMVFWMTGLSGAGKTSLAERVALKLKERRLPAVILDGDIMRRGLCSDLGFSERDREENNRRCAEMAKILAKEARQICLCAFISPLESMRRTVRRIVGTEHLRLVFVNCDIEICMLRDPKGNYAKARQGLMPGYTGLAAPYEPPETPDITINTDSESLETCTKKLLTYILEQTITTSPGSKGQ